MDANLDRAKVLTEALPYIQQYNGKIVVINCGGVPMTDPELREAVMSDIIMLRLVGIKVVLVHGIGPEAKEALKNAGMELQYKDGYPCVSDDALDVVQQVLCGKVNKGLVSALNQKGGKAIGLCGIDGGLLSAKTISPSYGRTGEVVKVDVTMVNSFRHCGGRQAGSGSGCGEAHPAHCQGVYAAESRCSRRPHARAASVQGARSDPLRSHLSDHGAQGELQCGGGAFRRQVRHLPGRHRTSRHSAGAAVRRGHRHHADPLIFAGEGNRR